MYIDTNPILRCYKHREAELKTVTVNAALYVVTSSGKLWYPSKTTNCYSLKYVKQDYATVDAFHRHSLQILHEFYESYGSPPAGLKVLGVWHGPNYHLRN